ncbi:hypothetical protein ACJBU6_05864 [Exserohilum turcicum]
MSVVWRRPRRPGGCQRLDASEQPNDVCRHRVPSARAARAEAVNVALSPPASGLDCVCASR